MSSAKWAEFVRVPTAMPAWKMGLFLLLNFFCLLAFLFQGTTVRAKIKLPLAFSKNGNFKVVIFSDLHYGENAWDLWGPAQDIKSTKVMNTILDLENPNFVIFLGDQVTANNLMSSNASLYWDALTVPCRERSVPWAAVFGNHDAAPFSWNADWFGPAGIPRPYSIPQDVEFGGGHFGRQLQQMQVTSKFGQLQNDKKEDLSYSEAGPLVLWPSVGNYFVPIYGFERKSVSMFFYFLDSGGGDTPEIISHAQGKWLNETMNSENKDGKPEFLFVHIPLPAMANVGPPRGTPIEAPCVGNNSADSVTPVTADFGLVQILEGRESFKASFSGHDHGNDWCCPHGNFFWLCFARHTGYGGYGGWIRGAKVLNFAEYPFSLETWIRFEDGSVDLLGNLESLR